LKKTLMNISTSLLSLPGTSPDLPVVCCTQLLCSTPIFVERPGGHSALHVARCLQRRTRQDRVHSGEAAERHCLIGTLRITQRWHPRSWRKSGRRARTKPRCPIRACRFNSCRAHFVVSSVRDGIWETCRIQTPVPVKGCAGSTPAGRTHTTWGRW
jgi:hypothetical protein